MQEAATSTTAPVSAKERITSVDTLRGFALLGILLMNIIPFSMYGGAYDNPTVTGGATGANLAVWAVLHVLAEGKMRCLFSLVFGASMLLLTSRLESSGKAADIYYRRTLWLLLFGIAHFYLLWVGEILYPYALCGLVLFPFRKMVPKHLISIGCVFLVASSAGAIFNSLDTKEKIEKGRAAIAAQQAGQKLTEDQQTEKTKYEDWMKTTHPSPEQLEKDAKKWRGNFFSVVAARAEWAGMFHAIPFYHPMHWDIWSMMFIGMGLYKLGWITGEKPTGHYLKMLAIGYGIGIPLKTWTALSIIQSNFDDVHQAMLGTTYDLGRLTVACGHLALIMLLCRSTLWNWLTSRLAAVGQTAFSNYVMHSVICSFIFTGYGLGMYGRWERHQVYYVVAAIWVVQLIISPIWLRYYRFGPLEWGWRSLTYWQRQPMRLAREQAETAAA